MAPRDHHRFPRGETCSECPARRWYLENGRRYCENGHQVEGYIQFDLDEDDNFGKTARAAPGSSAAARKRRERDRQASQQHKHLAGDEARELFLECLQLLLRKQVLWLVRRRGLHPALEGVCRDLWVLRVRGCPGLVRERGRDGGARKGDSSDGEAKGKGKGKGGGGGLEMFSSQSQGEGKQEGSGGDGAGGEGQVWTRKKKSWDGESWSLPLVMDTLAIAYLGCVLRQEPVRIGDVFRWARNNQLPFLGAIDYLPKEWRDRLPGWAQQSLLTRYAKFHGGELHRAVMDLILGYQENHGLLFPPIPAPPLLFLYVRDLALPPEVHPFAQRTCRLLGMNFSFPARGGTPTRYLMLDIPEVMLIASLVVATKHMYPLDGVERFPRGPLDPLCHQMDWAAWMAEFKKQPEKKPGILQYADMDPQKIWSMSKEEIDEFLNWFQETQIEKRPTDETELHRLFPLSDIQPLPEMSEVSQEDIEARTKRVQNAMQSVEPLPQRQGKDESIKRLGSDYCCYKEVDELEGPVRRFYEVVAETAGLSLRDLVRAVYSLEQLLMDWQRKERRRLRDEQGAGLGR